MDTGRRLVAGSRNRNEFVVINADDFERVSAIKTSSFYPGVRSFLDSWVIVDGATHPETCYEYERREGTQACPQCKTRYKRHKGSPRVEGDEEEDGDDDLEKEFNFGNFDSKETLNDPVTNLERPGGVGQSSLSGLGTFNTIVQTNGTNILLLTDGEEVG
ncbi:hypothetical protein BHM03_00004690 [Ensete ventricosum]|uniref:Cellulose synthase RING-type zinc finger domain-containing protein n=1 Tax=Ensete ventricosum TaxID=4639 RepID=A0A445MAS3_ENSVE|nr:hypothetical protein BHM03_00004690 [Ensete ventricosum]